MIISRTPLRLPLGGGGTDLPSYYSKYEGSLISVAISKFMYIVVNRNFDKNIKVSYRKIEIVDDLDKLEHPIAREALRLTNVNEGIEVFSMADVPANTGLGSSGAYAVGLLNALYAYKRRHAMTQAIAEEACRIEIDILGSPVGKQDQYIAAYGGLTKLDIARNGKVTVSSPAISPDALETLESNLLMFYTGFQRSASDVLKEQDKSTQNDETEVVENLHRIKDIGMKIYDALDNDKVNEIGPLFHEHWMSKKKLSGKISNPEIDKLYEYGMKNGATGGKVIGAGGGGFMVFYCPNEKNRLKAAMKEKNAPYFPLRFEFEGSKIIFNA